MLSPVLKVKSAVLFSLFPTHFVSPEKINPLPALSLQILHSSREEGQKHKQCDISAIAAMHSKASCLGNAIM